jgi:hypothetical protein
MQTKPAELAALLKNRKIYRVTIETPARGTLKETVIEDPEGIDASAEGDTLTFAAKGGAASFTLLETAQILTNHVGGIFVIVTLAGNGGLQILCREP